MALFAGIFGRCSFWIMTIKLVQGSPALLYCVYIAANLSFKYANGSSLTASLVGLNSWIPRVETLCHAILYIFMSLWGCVCLVSRYRGMSICREGGRKLNLHKYEADIFCWSFTFTWSSRRTWCWDSRTRPLTKDICHIFQNCFKIWEFGKVHMITTTCTGGCVCRIGKISFIIK